jgi:hypothetical protein
MFLKIVATAYTFSMFLPPNQPEPFVIGEECKLVLCTSISEDVFVMNCDPGHERVESSAVSQVKVFEQTFDVRIDRKRSITEKIEFFFVDACQRTRANPDSLSTLQ